MGVWNSSKQTVQDIIPVFLLLSLLTEKAKEEQKKMATISSYINESLLKQLTWDLVKFKVHFDITRLLVVAERTGELRLQISCHFLLRRGLSFGLAATHCAPTESSLCEKETKDRRLQQEEHVGRVNTIEEGICEKYWQVKQLSSPYC
ncbi:hypothetical protein ABVT39_017736 [Epinephelus coioides]